jgi:hypothetical protein
MVHADDFQEIIDMWRQADAAANTASQRQIEYDLGKVSGSDLVNAKKEYKRLMKRRDAFIDNRRRSLS